MNQEALERFYEALEQVKWMPWTVTEMGRIRADGPGCKFFYCPLEAATPNHPSVEIAGKQFGLSYADSWLIAHSADRTQDIGYDPAIRARMLEILGLQEVS